MCAPCPSVSYQSYIHIPLFFSLKLQFIMHMFKVRLAVDEFLFTFDYVIGSELSFALVSYSPFSLVQIVEPKPSY